MANPLFGMNSIDLITLSSFCNALTTDLRFELFLILIAVVFSVFIRFLMTLTSNTRYY